MKRIIAPVLVSVCLTLLPTFVHADTITLHIYNFDFGNSVHTHVDPVIHLGDTVHWVWDSGFHSTTAAASQSEAWNSTSGVASQFPAGFDHLFTHTGTFNYYCKVHGQDNGNGTVSGMSGRITVVPAPSALLTMGFGLASGVGLALRRRKVKL